MYFFIISKYYDHGLLAKMANLNSTSYGHYRKSILLFFFMRVAERTKEENKTKIWKTKFWKVEQNWERWITDDWLPRLGKPGLKPAIDRARNLIKKVSKIRRTRYFRPGNRKGRIKKMIRIYWQRK